MGQGPFLKRGLGAIRLIWRGELNSEVVGCPVPVGSRAKELSWGHYVYWYTHYLRVPDTVWMH